MVRNLEVRKKCSALNVVDSVAQLVRGDKERFPVLREQGCFIRYTFFASH